MVLRYMLGSWNPNKYHHLHELSLTRLAVLVIVTAALSALAFILLLLPAVFQADVAAQQLRATTNVTVTAAISQTAPTYLVRNPDILVTTGPGDAFITITPEHIAVKRFIYFDTETYPWKPLSSLDTLPAAKLFASLALFMLPSFVMWGTLLLLGTSVVLALLYTQIAYFILHARNFRIQYVDLWKVSLYATIPSMLVFGVIPILRLGLPLAIILGFQFVLWMVFALLGTALFAEKHTGKFKVNP